jgi:hypothetical protein
VRYPTVQTTRSWLIIVRRRLDPIFAISIGLAAAATRINREEKEKGRSTAESVDVLRRRWSLAWQNDAQGKKN